MIEYKIYKLIAPEHLQGKDDSGYRIATIDRYVLEEVDTWDMGSPFTSLEAAVTAIENNQKTLRGEKLVILPIITVPYGTDW